MRFKRYTDSDYDAVCHFLIELNQKDGKHINWNWARFEWMMEHPEFDASLKASIGLWLVGKRIVGAAIYDMYFGEAFCGVLEGYDTLYPEVLDYAWRELKDDEGLGIAISKNCPMEIAAAEDKGFLPSAQCESIMWVSLDHALPVRFPDGMLARVMDPGEQMQDFLWLLWQGFDHGEDRGVFEKTEQIITKKRKHFNRELSLCAVGPDGENAAYCCLWYDASTDYAYVEPLCTIPEWRGKGVGKALLCEGLNRARALGAKNAYVISDLPFYEKAGFEIVDAFQFYRKTAKSETMI